MGVLGVLAQALAVVGGDHEQGAVRAAGGLDGRHQARELRVHVGDLSVVESPAKVAAEATRGLVGVVCVEVVHPGEDGGLTGPRELALEPGDGRVRDAGGVALVEVPAVAGGTGGVDLVVVVLEALGQAVALVERFATPSNSIT